MPECPMCRTALDSSAVLCVHCGYHLEQQTFLATQVNRAESAPVSTTPAVDSNPYAPSALVDESPAPYAPEFDLTERGAAKANAVVSDAGNIWIAVPLSCFCLPLYVLMLPWYGYRLYCWYQLNDAYAELRFPNSFSPHGDLAAKFQSAKMKLIVGVVVGALLWLVLLLGQIASIVDGKQARDRATLLRHGRQTVNLHTLASVATWRKK